MLKQKKRVGLARRLGFISAGDGTRLAYELLGAAAPARTLVLCDGVGCAGYIWKYLLPTFAPTLRILHGQYRAHGRSELPRDLSSMNVEQLADDLLRLLQVLPSDEPIILAGHSMGVQVALEFYRRHPERVAALILINGAAGNALRYVHGTPLFAKALPSVRDLLGRWQPLVKKYWKTLLDSELAYQIGLALEVNPKLTKREDFRPYFREIAALDPQAFFTALGSAERHSAWDLLPAVKVPVLLIASEDDRFTPLPLMEKMHALIPKSHFELLPAATHIGPLEKPEEMNRAIALFLENLTKNHSVDAHIPERYRPEAAGSRSSDNRAAPSAGERD